MNIRFLAAILVLAGSPICFGQATRLPRDLDKLLPRVQEFWKLSEAGQKLKAVEFVLPEKRDQFVSSSTLPYSQPRFVALEFTGDPARVVVRTLVRMMVAIPGGGGATDFPVNDEWVWVKSNWFMDLRPAEDPFERQTSVPQVIDEQARKDLESTFKLGVEAVDLGRILQGNVETVSVPFQYSGKETVRIESRSPNSLAWLDESTTHAITQTTTNFRMLLDATEFEGPFEFSFPIVVRLNDILINRVFVVRGNVFAPITFRQAPAVLSSSSPDPFEVIVRNNTTEAVPIISIMSDGKLNVLAAPDRLEAQSETVIRFARRSMKESIPERIWIAFSKPIEKKDLYDYRLRWAVP